MAGPSYKTKGYLPIYGWAVYTVYQIRFLHGWVTEKHQETMCVMVPVVLAFSTLSSCVVNSHQTLTGHNLTCDLWCTYIMRTIGWLINIHEIFQESKGWD